MGYAQARPLGWYQGGLENRRLRRALEDLITSAENTPFLPNFFSEYEAPKADEDAAR